MAAIGRLALRRTDGQTTMRDALPPGYKLCGVGAVVFAVAGIGDAAWHTQYGIERGTEALYSPTHLLLLAGLVLIVSGPARAVAHEPSPPEIEWREFGPAYVSIALTVSIIAFFAPWGLYRTDWYHISYDPATGRGDTELNAALAAELVTTTILIGATLVVLHRWRPPFATFAFLYASTAIAFTIAFDGTFAGIAAAFIGGLCVDVAVKPLRSNDTTPHTTQMRISAAAFVGPLVLWSTYHLLLFASGDLAWSAPAAAGTPLLCALAGAAMTALL